MKTEFCRYISKISVTSESLEYRMKYFDDSDFEKVFPCLEKVKLACSILTSVLGEFEDVRKELKSEIVENEKNV